MVFRTGRYYGALFQVLFGVTQGYPLSPTIFNMLVGSVIGNWVRLFVGGEEVPEVFGRSIQWLTSFFLTPVMVFWPHHNQPVSRWNWT